MKRNAVLCAVLLLISAGISIYIDRNTRNPGGPIVFSRDFSLKQLAEGNEIPVKEILHILSHENPLIWNTPRDQPIKRFVPDLTAVKKAIEHIRDETSSSKDSLKYILWAVYLSFILLVIFKRKNIGTIRTLVLILTLLLFGMLLGATPNPMESLVKMFKFLNTMVGAGSILVGGFILFTLFSIIGSKFICSWGCPLGAVQESLFNIPVSKRKYKIKIPFLPSLALRITIFAIFVVLLFGLGYGVLHGVKNFVIYHHVNYFKIFDYHELAKIALYTLPVFVMASIFIFRPFCHFICPFGLYSWILENVALNKICIDKKKCIRCGQCVSACPTNAMRDIFDKERKYLIADCWSCGKCIDICPVDAIKYGAKGAV